MITISRKVGERIMIGEAITVSVVAVKGNQARMGIDAPTYVQILRAELLARIESQAVSVEL